MTADAPDPAFLAWVRTTDLVEGTALWDVAREAFAAACADHERFRAALELIRTTYGQVCPEYEVCEHPWCAASYGAWATAAAALHEDDVGDATVRPVETEGDADVRRLPLRPRVSNALWRAGVRTTAYLSTLSDDDLLAIPGLGVGGVDEIRRAQVRAWIADEAGRVQPDRSE